MEMNIEYIKSFSKELNKIAFFGSLLKPTFGKITNAVFGGMSIAGASKSAKQSGQSLGNITPLSLGPSQNFLKTDINAKSIGRTSI
jgi:hypothetical protein